MSGFSYTSTIPFESTLAPGLVFQLRKMSYGRRKQHNLDVAEVDAELRELDRQIQPLLEEIKRAEEAAKIEPCICEHAANQHDEKTGRCLGPGGCKCREPKPAGDAYAEWIKLIQQREELIIDELAPFRIRWAVESIDGEIDGKPATVDSFLAKMPDDIVGELHREIERVMKLSLDEQLGFKSPTTSAAAVDGQKNGTPVANASVPDGITAATAASTSPAI